MLKHIVGWTIKDSANGKTKSEILDEMVVKIQNLKDQIPYVKSLEIGVNALDAANKNLDVCFIMEFEGMKELDLYQVHPVHQEFVTYVRTVREERVAIDYFVE